MFLMSEVPMYLFLAGIQELVSRLTEEDGGGDGEGQGAANFISQKVFIKLFAKVNSRTNPSTYPLLLLI